MEFEVLSTDLEWEAQRHAVAFGLTGWDVIGCDLGENSFYFSAKKEGVWFECSFGLDDSTVWGLAIDDFSGRSGFDKHDVFLQIDASSNTIKCRHHLPSNESLANEMVARMFKVLYLLGRPTEALETKLGLAVTAHEKLELRLSMPREFWPQKWLDEEGV